MGEPWRIGVFSPEKWRILISFNEDYKKPDCSFNQNNEGRTYARGLDNYLRNVPTYDDETGQRHLFNLHGRC